MGKTGDNIIYHNFRADASSVCSGLEASAQQESREDWRRFCVVQLDIYLSSKRSGRITSAAERDMIQDLLSVYWEEILASGILEGLTLVEKLRLFRGVCVDFPFLEMTAPDGFIPLEG